MNVKVFGKLMRGTKLLQGCECSNLYGKLCISVQAAGGLGRAKRRWVFAKLLVLTLRKEPAAESGKGID